MPALRRRRTRRRRRNRSATGRAVGRIRNRAAYRSAPLGNAIQSRGLTRAKRVTLLKLDVAQVSSKLDSYPQIQKQRSNRNLAAISRQATCTTSKQTKLRAAPARNRWLRVWICLRTAHSLTRDTRYGTLGLRVRSVCDWHQCAAKTMREAVDHPCLKPSSALRLPAKSVNLRG